MKQNDRYPDSLSEFERQSAVSRALNSIRTRYSLATAFLLLMALAVFYIGGRIVLVHLIRDTEQQVKEIGSDISRIAYRNADHVRKALLSAVAEDGGATLAADGRFSVFGRFGTDGAFISCQCKNEAGTLEQLGGDDLAAYAPTLAKWCESTARRNGDIAATGIMRLCGRSHYVALAKSGGECLLLGMPFESNIFTSQVNEGLSGLDVRITNRKAEISVGGVASDKAVRLARSRSDFGIAPMFSEALNFYSGGFWNLGTSQYEAVYAVRDIAGNAVTMVSVSIPKTFSAATQSAIGRLAFFVAMVGIIFVLPVFWFQSRVLLNPLTRMTEAIAALGKTHRDTDCPRLEWTGKDEFALLAVSVNRMLETISARSLAVAQSESRQRALIDAIPDALAVFDRQHRLVTMTKDSADPNAVPFAVSGGSFSEPLFGSEGKRKFESALDRVFADEKGVESLRLELQHAKWVPQDQPSRHFDIRLVKMDEHFALALIRDITDMVEEHRQLVGAREKLKEGEKRESLALLAAGIAHDVNNILTIIGNTTVATWVDPASPEERKAVDTIGDALKRGSMMMRELMEYAGESRIVLERTSPRTMIGDIENILRGLLADTVELKLDVPADLPDIDAGRNQLFKVFMNIVKNAAEALGRRPGRIVVAARKFELSAEELLRYRSSKTLKPGTGVLFTVSDNGPGIRPEIVNRLFDPYVSSKALGRGLGLAIVASVVESHGGGIRVDSVMDRGTTFSIFLPESRLPKAVVAATEGAAASAASAPAGGGVLVVDDEDSILKTTSMLLKSLRYSPVTARDSAEALEALRLHGDTLAAIILDASLGDVDTVRLALSFRKNAPTVPIVISSGSSEEYLSELFKDVKIAAFLGKPYTVGELRDTLAGLRA